MIYFSKTTETTRNPKIQQQRVHIKQK